MKRRDFVDAMIAVPVLAGLGGRSTVGRQQVRAWDPEPASKGGLRVVHLTDTHVYQDKNCPALARACLQRIREVAPKPDLVIHSGDAIFDALKTDKDEVTRQWKLWKELERELPKTPRYAIGNHDVFGQGELAHAKDWALEQFGLEKRYYRFDQGGWRFMVLDSTQPKGDGWYTAHLDEEQRAWLEGELAATPKTMPVAIVSHIPILSVAVIEWAKSAEDNWSVSNALMHSDSHEIQGLLRRYPNVKICLSGHLHLLDQVEYDGIDYLGNGAVSGDWWKGDTFHQTHCGFATLELSPDGSSKRQYFTYQWT